MKKLTLFFISIIVVLKLFSQVPEKMSYQAIVRNSSNELVRNLPIGMKVSIIQGSISGTIVYSEIYNPNPTTNTNGLVTLEIGNGIPIIGTFSSIDWSSGLYFIKTETDISGGTNYTIIGTSQLLSVPFALHAKTAESFSNTPIHYIGEFYGGGIIFWLDNTNQHGLIMSLTDISISHIWSNVSTTLIGTSAQSTWNGFVNSNAITGQIGHTNSAAKICLDYININYGTGIFSDWYLPSIDELAIIYQNSYTLNKNIEMDLNYSTTPLLNQWYFSSTEHPGNYVFVFDFPVGGRNVGSKSGTCAVRAIRAF